jgi:hypothetical protein
MYNFKKWLFIIFMFGFTLDLFSQAFLHIPIEGTQGNDWIIVNYVDWEVAGYKDHNCGSKSYDGHQGTDFVIRSFEAMDDSIAVYAAAAGTVTFTIDSLFDRETEGDISKTLGNYIAIKHPNKYYTYYAHLMKNSIQVEVGDNVEVGDLLGYVGSSGNSTDPHLHFELWYDSLFVVDPFSGDCGNEINLFVNPPAYDTSLKVWESGLHLKNELDINELRERIITIEKPYAIEDSSDSSLYFWAHMYGLKQGKELSIKWYTPNEDEWFEYSFTLDKDYWYYYYWSYIDHQNLPAGEWTVKLFYDGDEIANEFFEVNKMTSSNVEIDIDHCQAYKSWSFEKLINSDLDLRIFDLNGKMYEKKHSSKMPKGIYLVQIVNDKNLCVIKSLLD